MATLNTQPGSSRPMQRCLLHQIKRRRKWTDEQFHDILGFDSTKDMSAAQASEAIRRLGGIELANPPGQKPGVYKSKRAGAAIRKIHADHVQQIIRLGLDYFESTPALVGWLAKNFIKIPIPPTDVEGLYTLIDNLLTARRAGHVIMTLKRMCSRRKAS